MNVRHDTPTSATPTTSRGPGNAAGTSPPDAATRARYAEDARRVLHRLVSELADVEHQAAAAPGGAETAERLAPVFLELEADHRTAEATLARLEFAEDEWDDAAAAHEQAVRAFRKLLRTARADVAVEATEGAEQVPVAVREQVEAWEEQLDDLVVQAHLAGMEVRDELDRLAHHLEEVRRVARRTFVAGPLDDLMAATSRLLGGLRDGWSALRHQLSGRSR